MAVELRATYRLQLRPDFGFEAAAAVVDYLADLGVSHLYSSPQLQAAPGSTHGYDVVDHSTLDTDLGGEEGHARLREALTQHGLGMVLDIVPNHMAISGPENRWWWDVLENGPRSRFATFFDVEWDPPESYLRNKVLLPVLGGQYGRALEAGQIRLVHEANWFAIRYGDQTFPVSPESIEPVLRSTADRTGSDELGLIADVLAALPQAETGNRAAATRRSRDVDVLKRQLARLSDERSDVPRALADITAEINASPDALDAILERQNYRLAWWRAARRDLGYRRFFGINSLVGIRAEDERVFEETHRLVLAMVARGVVSGLRVDHPDGLRDPQAYFDRLRHAAPATWILAEKILQPGEELRDDWAVDGTAGYDFLNEVGGLFVDPAGEHALTELYAELVGGPADVRAVIRDKKDLVLGEELGSDLNRLTQAFVDLVERHRRYRDYTRDELHVALRGAISCMQVYRTYVRAEAGVSSPQDERWIREAIDAARERRPEIEGELFDLLAAILLLELTGPLETELVMRFQQLTSSAMAKGAEDTAFYTFNRLLSLNEVGGDPDRFGVSPAEFHHFAGRLAERWPRTMLTTSTHDTKRGEDVRLRISALSEMSDEWAATVRRWHDQNARHRGAAGPDPNDEYFIYQTLVGTWPIELARLDAYLEKAIREAKVHTTWARPNAGYEAAVREFAHAVLADERFCTELEAMLPRIVRTGQLSSLSQLLIKLTAPGVPDLYQGSELWDLSLVDPDNRRPVDYDRRRELLSFVRSAGPGEVLQRMAEGAPKIWLLHRALAARASHPGSFGPAAGYRPIEVRGSRAANVIAYQRGEDVLVIAPRLVMGLGEPVAWADTLLPLPPGRWRDALHEQTVAQGETALAALLEAFPVALLLREAS